MESLQWEHFTYFLAGHILKIVIFHHKHGLLFYYYYYCTNRDVFAQNQQIFYLNFYNEEINSLFCFLFSMRQPLKNLRTSRISKGSLTKFLFHALILRLMQIFFYCVLFWNKLQSCCRPELGFVTIWVWLWWGFHLFKYFWLCTNFVCELGWPVEPQLMGKMKIKNYPLLNTLLLSRHCYIH